MIDPKLSFNASRVLKARYLQRDASSRIIETPEQLFRRSARAIAQGETLLGNGSRVSYWEEEFYDMLISFDFLPNSPTLMNAGTPLGQLSVDWKKLRSTVRKAIRFLDNVIEVNRYPLPEIKRMTSGNRKIGLGVMGFAEMLIHLGISYDSDEAILRVEQIMRAIAEEAFQASQDLAEERGVFPNRENSLYKRQRVKVRNATRVAIAPTGTISIIAGTSNGIEPLFALT